MKDKKATFNYLKTVLNCLLFSCSFVFAQAGQWKVDASLPQPEFKKTTLPPRAMSDGKGGVYVWGFNNLIHNANGQRSGVVIKINATNGQHDTSFVLGTSLIEVLAGQVDSEGRLYVSGSAPGDATDEGKNFRIFRILTNGTVDASYTSPVFSAEPRWFRLLSDGRLMVSQPGRSSLGGAKVDKTVRLNPDGSLDQPFSKNTPSLDWASSFAPPIVDKQGRILLGGFVGGATGPLVRLLPTGQIDSSFVPSGFSILNASVRGIGLQTNGKIVLAGRFSTPKTGAASYGIVRLNDNGSLDTTFTLVTTTAAGFANALNPSGRARLLEVLSGDKIMAIGDRGLRRFNPDGSLDNSYPGLNFDADHYWMDVSPDGAVLVPSDFAGGNPVGSNKVVGIIKLKPDGNLDTGFRPPTFQEEVFPRALGLQSDGDLILSGGGWTGFDSVSGVSALGVAKLNTHLALNTAYRPFDSLTDFRGISSQVMAPDDTLFANVNLGPDAFNIENRIFKVSASGLKDPAFTLPGSGVSDLYWVNGLLVGSGNSAQAIVDRAPLMQRYNSSGSVDTKYIGIGSADVISQVFLTTGAIAKPPFDLTDVSIIKSGSFSIVAGLPDGRSYAAICHSTNYTQHRIVRLKVDGSRDPTFEPVVFGVLSNPQIFYPAISRGGVGQQIETWYPPSSPFTSGSVLTNGGLLLCGSFTNVQGFGTPGIVRINPDGSIDKTFNVGIGAGYSNRPGLTASIYKVLHLQNGQTLVLGTFDRFNKYPANGLVILESDGSVSPESPSDVALPPSAFEGSTVDAYAMGTDRVLLVGPFVHNHSAWPTAVTQLVRETDSVQSVQLQIGQNVGSIRVGWPSGLGWVQPQRQTDLAALVWQDLGAPTTANTLSETAGPTTGFYRLKFLPPTITQQPTAKSVAAGADVTLQVGVMGTEPMAYQWYKGNVRLTGKTGAQLSLSGVTSADAGNYSVWITNRAGTAASQGALLTVTTPTVRPSGIYMGNFSGQSDNGGFAAMIRSDGTAFVVGYNTPQEEGLFIPTWTLPADGTFTIKTVQKGTITGVFTSSAVAGTFSNSTGQSGAFSGNRKPDSGIHAKSAGYYAGTYDGAASGSAYAIIAADGSLFFYSVDNPLSPTADGDGGGFGVINAANALSGTTVPNGFQLQGTINPTTGVLTGTYSLGGTALGTFRVVRTQTP